MRFQERDGAILTAIYEYDGVLARRHLIPMFWPFATLRAMQRRMSLLCKNNYISRPTYEQWRTLPVPEPVYWLDWKGILWVAAQRGIDVGLPKNPSEDDTRELAKQLRRREIRWLDEPRWIQLPHDLAVTDVRLAAKRDLDRLAAERVLENFRNGLTHDQCRLVRYASHNLYGFFPVAKLAKAFCKVSAADGGHGIGHAAVQGAVDRLAEMGLLKPSIVPNLQRITPENITPPLIMQEWLYESMFRSNADIVDYYIKDRHGTMSKRNKRVYPDSYFVIVDQQRLAQGLLARARFLLELDNSTHPGKRFGREKVAPGLAYIKSPAYKTRFGVNSGLWLIVTTGKVRMKNLMRQTRRVVGAEASQFLFTTLHLVKTGNVLTEPIWLRGDSKDGSKKPVTLFTQY